MSVADYNGDAKADIGVINYNSNSVSVLKNMSTTGMINFAPVNDYATMANPRDISAGDLDGDSKPDLVIGSSISGVISIFKNISSLGQIDFATNVDYTSGNYSTFSAIGDLNGDGRPDIAVANSLLNTVSILRNKIGAVTAVILCPPLSNTTIPSNLAGLNYQWQVNTGGAFANISDNSNYNGSGTTALQLVNIPSSWYGYKFRCIADGETSDIFELRFSDTWTGTAGSAWEDPSNWSCGSVPDNNTDVVVNSGTLVINSNVTIRTLKIKPGATITVNTGFNLTVLR